MTPPAAFTTEEATSAVDQSGLATHKVAMGLWWTNQVHLPGGRIRQAARPAAPAEHDREGRR